MQQMVSLLQILLLSQHVSGTIIPIIMSSRVLYSDTTANENNSFRNHIPYPKSSLAETSRCL